MNSPTVLFAGGTYHKDLSFCRFGLQCIYRNNWYKRRSILIPTSQISPRMQIDDGIHEFGDEFIWPLQGSTGMNRYDSTLDNVPISRWSRHRVDFPVITIEVCAWSKCDVYIDGVIDSLDILYSAYASLSLQYYTPPGDWSGPNSISNNPYFPILVFFLIKIQPMQVTQ